MKLIHCAECGQLRDAYDGQNLEYDDPTSTTGVALRFVCGPCERQLADVANAWAATHCPHCGGALAGDRCPQCQR